jgi:hypothetical protein
MRHAWLARFDEMACPGLIFPIKKGIPGYWKEMPLDNIEHNVSLQ